LKHQLIQLENQLMKQKTFVKYDMPMPSSVASLTSKSQEYTYDEILNILATPEWTDPNPYLA